MSSCKWLFYVFALIYLVSNLFVFIVSWFPGDFQQIVLSLQPNQQVVSSFVGPVIVSSCIVAGIIHWLCDLYVLPWLGYSVRPLQESREGLNIKITFGVSVTSLQHSTGICC